MHAWHPAFSAQVFEVDPSGGFWPLSCGVGQKGLGQSAAKGFDPDISRRQLAQQRGVAGLMPRQNLNLIISQAAPQSVRGHPAQGRGIVNPKTHGLTRFSQLPSQPPAHPQIAMVVNDSTKNVPKASRVHGMRLSLRTPDRVGFEKIKNGSRWRSPILWRATPAPERVFPVGGYPGAERVFPVGGRPCGRIPVVRVWLARS